jgi:hypothetical protein
MQSSAAMLPQRESTWTIDDVLDVRRYGEFVLV